MTDIIKPEATDNTIATSGHTLVLLNTDNYAFKDVKLKGNEWIDFNEDYWVVCNIAAPNISMLINSSWGGYCFVFWNEANQPSQPYPTVQEAMNARKHYMENL